VGLEKIATGLGGMEDAQDSEIGKGQVVDTSTFTGDVGVFYNVTNRCEKFIIEKPLRKSLRFGVGKRSGRRGDFGVG
jgi:hypothetical protein